ncbi:hypothetical protein QUF79_07530 [Fictibacillus enclensis]|uniref:hypothetical protein n=1 Tax=Fictibacillus enclensis TaxID=1017270 RepID=UPI0025A02E69|nr:hypothetical protein [Fictibacillus enclensis]MDM5197864.1 hypothetical protein [Fictibacillus enclensis]
MAFEVIDGGMPVETVRVCFEIPGDDYEAPYLETFRGFLVNERHVIFRAAGEINIVKVEPTEQVSVYKATSSQMTIGSNKPGVNFQALVYELISKLERMSAWDLLASVLPETLMDAVNLNIIEGVR